MSATSFDRPVVLSRPSQRSLPAWPLLGQYWLFLVGWVLGLGSLWSVVAGAVMLLYLYLYADIEFPRAMVPWWYFLLAVTASIVMIDSLGRFIGFGFRWSNYASATIAFLYIYNSSHRSLSDLRLARALTAYWAAIVAGGYLGVLAPEGELITPLARVLPGWLAENELVAAWTRPTFSAIQDPWGSPEPFIRPSAPFAFANTWGTNFALSAPFVLAAFIGSKRRGRVVIGCLVVASLVPAAATLNRGMFLALGVGLAYVSIRMALRGRIAPLLTLSFVGVLVTVVAFGVGLVDRILLRTSYSSTTDDRLAIYRETVERTLESPIIGWGGPRPSHVLRISVGTQGHFWNVMFSHGLIALLCFALAFAVFIWKTRNCSGVGFAAHVTLVMVLITIVYYGYDGPQMMVAMTAAAIGLRQIKPQRRQSEHPRAVVSA